MEIMYYNKNKDFDMKLTKEVCQRKIKNIFTINKTICRVFASFFFVFFLNLSKTGYFTQLAFSQDTSLVFIVLMFVLAFIVLSVLAFFLDNLPVDSWFLFVLATILSISWVIKAGYTGNNRIYFAIAVIIFYGIVIIYTINENKHLLDKIEPNKYISLGFMIACGITLFIVLCIVGVNRYRSYQSPNFDFGIFAQIFANIKKTGLPLVTSERNVLISHFNVHLSPIFYLIMPIYLVFSSPITLQVMQALILASGIIPVWLLCRKLDLSGKATMLISLIYMFFPLITNGTFYDFHENCFLLPLLLWTFYFLEDRKIIPMAVFALLTLLVKEDAAIYILIFGLYLVFVPKKRIIGASLIVASLIYFFIAIYIINTYGLGIMSDSRFGNLIYEADDGLIGVIKTVLVNPGYALTQVFNNSESFSFSKLFYFIIIILPLGALPLATKKPSRLILLMPILINLISGYNYQTDITFQYHFGVGAFYLYAMMLNLKDLSVDIRGVLLPLGTISAIVLYFAISYPTIDYYNNAYKNNKSTWDEMNEILELIPEDASVSASTFILPHLANHSELYETYYQISGESSKFVYVDYVVIETLYSDSASDINYYINKGYTVLEERAGIATILIYEGE